MDPRHGELSRALRNRGIEICILGDVSYALFVDSCHVWLTWWLKKVSIYCSHS